MVELLPIDNPYRTAIQAELALGVIGDYRDRAPTRFPHDLQRHGSQPAGRAPHQYGVALLDHIS